MTRMENSEMPFWKEIYLVARLYKEKTLNHSNAEKRIRWNVAADGPGETLLA